MTIPTFDFTPAFVAAVAGIVLSLAMTYIPGLRTWYGALLSQTKSLIMLGLMVLCSVVIVLLAQYGIIPTTHPLTWVDCAVVVVSWLISNQATYTLAPVPVDVYHVILERDQMLTG